MVDQMEWNGVVEQNTPEGRDLAAGIVMDSGMEGGGKWMVESGRQWTNGMEWNGME